MKDLAGDSQRYGKPVAGMHLAPWLIDSMRHLLGSQHWRVNAGSGRVWYGSDGVYLVWPLAANDLRSQLKANHSPFVPSTVEILAEILMGADIIVSNGEDNSYLFDIGVPQAESSALKYFTAVRLSNQEVLLKECRSAEPLKMALLVGASGLVDISHWVEVDDGDDPGDGGTGEGAPVAEAAAVKPLVKEKKKKPERPPVSTPMANRYDDDFASQYLDTPPVYDPTILDGDALGLSASNEEAIRFLTGKKPDKGFAERGKLMVDALKQVRTNYLSKLPQGITKVQINGVEEAGIDPRDCVKVLKESGILVPVEGEDVASEQTKSGEKLYFLMKGDVSGT
jgi:hypothetical protein